MRYWIKKIVSNDLQLYNSEVVMYNTILFSGAENVQFIPPPPTHTPKYTISIWVSIAKIIVLQ